MSRFKWVVALFAVGMSLQARGQNTELKVMSFNILYGGRATTGIGLTSPLYNKPRYDDIVGVILAAGADVVGIQEDDAGTAILSRLQAVDPNWNRRGAIYSRFPLVRASAADPSTHISRVIISENQSVVVHNAHWWPGGGYGPRVAKDRIVSTGSVTEAYILANSGFNGTPQRNPTDSLAHVQPFLDAGDAVFVVGDFNEPSHLDWTANYATNGGPGRLVSNPTAFPMNLKVEWPGSKQLADAGLRDAYREVFPDEVAKPGNSWTRPYENSTPGHIDYYSLATGGQELVRIDGVLYAGNGVAVIDAAVVGEDPTRPEHANPAPAP